MSGQDWVIFGKYKWSKACVELAKDSCKNTGKSLLETLHTEFGAYRWPV